MALKMILVKAFYTRKNFNLQEIEESIYLLSENLSQVYEYIENHKHYTLLKVVICKHVNIIDELTSEENINEKTISNTN